MSQVQAPKLSLYTAIGPNSDEESVVKLSLYVLLVPGEDSGDTPSRQVHVFTQKIRRA